MSNNDTVLPILPPDKSPGMFELPGVEAEPLANAYYAHCTGPEDASVKVSVSGRIIIASNLLPWELSFGKDADWVPTFVQTYLPNQYLMSYRKLNLGREIRLCIRLSSIFPQTIVTGTSYWLGRQERSSQFPGRSCLESLVPMRVQNARSSHH